MSWLEMLKPDGKRLLLNLDQVFCFDEQQDGKVLAVSITGTGAPTGATIEETMEGIKLSEG
jgi:hypothetical protein